MWKPAGPLWVSDDWQKTLKWSRTSYSFGQLTCPWDHDVVELIHVAVLLLQLLHDISLHHMADHTGVYRAKNDSSRWIIFDDESPRKLSQVNALTTLFQLRVPHLMWGKRVSLLQLHPLGSKRDSRSRSPQVVQWRQRGLSQFCTMPRSRQWQTTRRQESDSISPSCLLTEICKSDEIEGLKELKNISDPILTIFQLEMRKLNSSTFKIFRSYRFDSTKI